jgi:hypothetical protein
LFLSALYHDIAKPDTRAETQPGRIRFLGHDERGAAAAARRARALALSVQEVERVEAVVAHHMRIHQMAGMLQRSREQGTGEKVSRRAIYRFFQDTREAGVDICMLSLADVRGTYGVTLPQDLWEAELTVCRLLLEAYWEQHEEVVAPPRLLTGNEVMQAFGITPGPELGRLFAGLREAQAAGEVQTREDALAFADQWLKRSGRGPNREDPSLEEREP